MENTASVIPPLQPGDCILYRPTDLFDWAVALKTFTKVSHVEVYIGGELSVASRNGKGVDLYPTRREDIAAVRRPRRVSGDGCRVTDPQYCTPAIPAFDIERALNWFYYGTPDNPKARYQKYGWRTLLSFVLLNSNPIEGHMICSEFAAEFYKAGGYPVFSDDWPSYRTPPSYFLSTRRLTPIWDDGRIFS